MYNMNVLRFCHDGCYRAVFPFQLQDMDHPPAKHRFDELTWCAHRFPQNEKVVHETCSMNMFAT